MKTAKHLLLPALAAILLSGGCMKHSTDGYVPPVGGTTDYFDYSTTREYAVSVDYNTVGYKTDGAMDFAIYDEYPYVDVEVPNGNGKTRIDQQFIGTDGLGRYSVDGEGNLTAPQTGQTVTLADGRKVAAVEPLFRSATEAKGKWSGKATMPTRIEAGDGSVWIYTKWANRLMNIPEVVEVKVVNGRIDYPAGIVTRAASRAATRLNGTPAGTLVLGNATDGTYGWDEEGLPKYLLPGGSVATSLFHDIMAFFPEYRRNVDRTDSEGVSIFGRQGNIEAEEDFEVKLTFVHDGGTQLNSVGYYWYKKGETPENGGLPSTLAGLKSLTRVMAFPNASYANGGGGSLSSGDEIQLMYTPDGGVTWSKTFPEEVSVGFFMFSPGFDKPSGDVSEKSWGYTYFSDCTEANQDVYQFPQQGILLRPEAPYDVEDGWNVTMLAWEDKYRDSGDNDYNDAIFLVKTSAEPTGSIPDLPVDPTPDPEPDPIDNYIVYEGTLAFEDLWPSKGDYDMNDVVIEYRSVVMMDKQNRVVGMIDSLTPRWSGAAFHNAFGYELDLDYGQYVTSGYTSMMVNTNYSATAPADDGSRVNHDFPGSAQRFNFAAGGFEAGQAKAVVILFDDIKSDNVLGAMVPDFARYIASGRKPDPAPQYWFRVSTRFGSTVPSLGDNKRPTLDKVTPPYNPFIVVTYSEDVNKNQIAYSRGREIHLISSVSTPPEKYKPTSLAVQNSIAQWYGANDDRSEPGSGYYFLSNQSYPWAINIPIYKWNFPMETKKVDDTNYGYPAFEQWASSAGATNTDWYMHPGPGIGTLGGGL